MILQYSFDLCYRIFDRWIRGVRGLILHPAPPLTHNLLDRQWLIDNHCSMWSSRICILRFWQLLVKRGEEILDGLVLYVDKKIFKFFTNMHGYSKFTSNWLTKFLCSILCQYCAVIEYMAFRNLCINCLCLQFQFWCVLGCLEAHEQRVLYL